MAGAEYKNRHGLRCDPAPFTAGYASRRAAHQSRSKAAVPGRGTQRLSGSFQKGLGQIGTLSQTGTRQARPTALETGIRVAGADLSGWINRRMVRPSGTEAPGARSAGRPIYS